MNANQKQKILATEDTEFTEHKQTPTKPRVLFFAFLCVLCDLSRNKILTV